jgi:hypothetical protein
VITIKLSHTAVVGLNRGYRYYERKEIGLGNYFKNTLLAEIEGLSVTAGIHRMVRGHHRMISRVFPYAIYYKFSNETADVRAVIDCRRNPDWIYKQLKDP